MVKSPIKDSLMAELLLAILIRFLKMLEESDFYNVGEQGTICACKSLGLLKNDVHVQNYAQILTSDEKKAIFLSVVKVLLAKNGIKEIDIYNEIDYMYSRLGYPDFMAEFVSYMPARDMSERLTIIEKLRNLALPS